MTTPMGFRKIIYKNIPLTWFSGSGDIWSDHTRMGDPLSLFPANHIILNPPYPLSFPQPSLILILTLAFPLERTNGEPSQLKVHLGADVLGTNLGAGVYRWLKTENKIGAAPSKAQFPTSRGGQLEDVNYQTHR